MDAAVRSPTPTRPTPAQGQAMRGFGPVVSDNYQSADTRISDAELESAINRARAALEAAQQEWEATSCFTAVAKRDEALRLFSKLLTMRSRAQIATMQREQAERMALEPGATKGHAPE